MGFCPLSIECRSYGSLLGVGKWHRGDSFGDRNEMLVSDTVQYIASAVQ